MLEHAFKPNTLEVDKKESDIQGLLQLPSKLWPALTCEAFFFVGECGEKEFIWLRPPYCVPLLKQVMTGT